MERGIDILIVGGDSPHVGGVVLSTPRASLSGQGRSSDSWVIPVAGHKDILVAKTIAELVCASADVPVVVTAGIHIEGASPKEILAIEKSCLKLAERLCKGLGAD